MKKLLFVDLETYSEVNIKDCGAYKYTASDTFGVMLIAYAVDNDEPTVLDLTDLDDTTEFLELLNDEGYMIVCHNATFERLSLNKFFKLNIPIERYLCTMALAATSGLPLSLDKVSEVLQLENAKLKSGKSLITYFCTPCKPTITNKGRTRNLSHHNPEKWEEFKYYCLMDVKAEMEIYYQLRANEPTPTERLVYCLDQKINDRGVMIDTQLANNAVNMDIEVKERLITRLTTITGLSNPNSAAQLKKWLTNQLGYEVDKLRKEDIHPMIDSTDNEDIIEVLRARQELGKTSVSKYSKMVEVVGSDSRARGLIQYYGASRTGRFAGRLIQIQNLPQNHIFGKELDMAREIALKGDTELMELQYGNVPNTLSQLIRTAFVAPKGKVFAVADYSQIEARVIAFLAGEDWRMKAFRDGEDIYISSASMMFGVDRNLIDKGSDYRKKGKVAELACIAEGQLVLTDKGLVPIEDITLNHLLWDGAEWVSHEGLIYKGIKKVIRYGGLKATEDHLVWVEGSHRAVQFGEAATSGARLVQTGDDRREIRMGDNNFSREKMVESLESLLRPNTMQRVRECTVAKLQLFEKGQVERLSAMLSTETSSSLARQTDNRRKRKMRQSKRQRVQQLRSERDSIQFQKCNRIGSLSNRNFRSTYKKFRIGQDRQQRTLRAWKYPFCYSQTEQFKQEDNSVIGVQARVLGVLSRSSSQKIKSGYDERANNRGCKKSSYGETKELENDCKEVRVYDIANVGRYNRFTVSNVLVHNCGFGGGVNALKNFAKMKDFLTPEQCEDEDNETLFDEELQRIINSWRQASPKIVKLWYSLDNAFKKALESGSPQRVMIPNNSKHIIFRPEQNAMTVELPSGRKLFYRQPSFTTNRFGSQSVCYMGMNQTTRQWQNIETYGGKLTENVVQAIARDLLCEVMLRVDKIYPIVSHTHDEMSCEVDTDTAEHDLQKMYDIMAEPISWANGLPTVGDGYITPYYKKD